MIIGPNKNKPVLLFLVAVALFVGGLQAVSAWADGQGVELFKNPLRELRKSSDPLRDVELLLEGGDSSSVQAFIGELGEEDQDEREMRHQFESILFLYQGDYPRALERLAHISPGPWNVPRTHYLNALVEITQHFEEILSPHFRFYASPRDGFLLDYARPALEKAHKRLAAAWGVDLGQAVVVEIYSSKWDFSQASTLPEKTLDRSGAIGICKFGRLMIMSPKNMPLGYRWLDALAHEFNHLLINRLSGSLCPLWLHEGVARYYETRWRRQGFALSPGAETQLARAVLKDQGKLPQGKLDEPALDLVSFKRMEPSMVYLKNQEEVSLAFSQVSDCVAFIVELFGEEKLGELLRAFRRWPRAQAFEKVLKMSEEELEQAWRDSLKTRSWKMSKGAMVETRRFGAVDEVQFSGANTRGHLRLGDRFRQKGRYATALIQYKKALALEPDNGVVLLKTARTLMALGRQDEAEKMLRHAVDQNKSYVTPYVALAHLLSQGGRWSESLPFLEEALEINPYYPLIHQLLAAAYEKQGQREKAQREGEIYNQLQSAR